jgi:phosphatidylinositol glycan class B
MLTLSHPTVYSLSLFRFLSLLALRLFLCACLQTSFVPDEYWQGPEVAHALAFGRGELTWEWQAALRSALHPALIAVVYKALAFVALDTPAVIAAAPMYLQGRSDRIRRKRERE